ncbi:MAG: hypothetical protein BWY65_01372 [Firmicutes bacterium ADurb.Bin373]|nr:MAG: hypothetical protein BWY65_01372 [Firmicutes bacterium ADurb.Bin373]
MFHLVQVTGLTDQRNPFTRQCPINYPGNPRNRAGTDQPVYFRHFPQQFLMITLGQTTGYYNGAAITVHLVPGQFQDSIYGFLLGLINK